MGKESKAIFQSLMLELQVPIFMDPRDLSRILWKYFSTNEIFSYTTYPHDSS